MANIHWSVGIINTTGVKITWYVPGRPLNGLKELLQLTCDGVYILLCIRIKFFFEAVRLRISWKLMHCSEAAYV